LRWNVQQGVIPIPSSTELSHITANFDIFDFHLAPEDMRAIDQLDQPASQRR
jgi:2,5-diketo-D-gluconate reductase A